jgi:WD40 repeat protein
MDGTARVWDALSGEERLQVAGHEGRINTAIWSPDGNLLATAGDDGTVRLWNAESGDQESLIEPETESVWSLAWSPDGNRLIIGEYEGLVAIWDATTVELLETLSGHTGFISDLALSPDGDRLASSDNTGLVRIWNIAPSTAWRTFPVSFAQGIDWSNDSRYLIVAGGDVVEDTEPPSFAIWDVVADQVAEEGLAADLQYKALYAFFSPDEKEILYAGLEGFPDFSGLGKIYVVDTWTGEILRDFSAEEGNVFRSYNWSPDGSQVAGGMFFSDDIWIFDSKSGDVIQKLSPANSELMINYLEWSPDGSKLASAGMDGTARVWDAQNWELAYTIDGHEPPAEVVNVTWSPDGAMIMTTSGNDERGAKDSTARIWDGDTGKELMVMNGHTKLVQFGAWSPDSSRVATASNDGTVRVWDVETGNELLTLDIPTLYGSAVWWSPDGQHLAIGGLGTQTSIWRVWQSTEELVEYAQECCVFRELTPEERERYGLAG